MKQNNIHLTYCQNIHKGEQWPENLAAIEEYAAQVKKAVAPDVEFGIGLRLSRIAAGELSRKEVLEKFRDVLKSLGMYVFTVNGFPYGPFHGEPVKEHVYEPDWRRPERLDYTVCIADLLAGLLPDGMNGSISTVPCSYREWIKSDKAVQEIVRNLTDCVVHLVRLHDGKGKSISLGLEPEPDCYIETTDDFIEFFENQLLMHGTKYLSGKLSCSPEKAEEMIRRHLSICFDTCHLALQFEDLNESIGKLNGHGISVSKLQVSAALKTIIGDDTYSALESFHDTVYLHQTKVRGSNGMIVAFKDLPLVTKDYLSSMDGSELRSHFHVPLYFSEYRGLQSTASDLTPAFFQAVAKAGCSQFEMETYTFDVLPGELRSMGAVQSIIKEYGWMKNKI